MKKMMLCVVLAAGIAAVSYGAEAKECCSAKKCCADKAECCKKDCKCCADKAECCKKDGEKCCGKTQKSCSSCKADEKCSKK